MIDTQSNVSLIDTLIFDGARNYSPATRSVFLQANPGLLDSINRPHPKLFEFYKRLKRQDWDENEFNLIQCQEEFLSVPKHIAKRMIDTLAWQWEGDSAAAHSVTPVIAPFLSDDDAWAGYQRIGDNEVLHALSYSEIVKLGLGGDARVRMQEVLANVHSMRRLAAVGNALAYVKRVGAKLTLGLITQDSDEAIDAAMLFVVTMLCLERIQFMQSFATTFAIGEIGLFIPIVSTVGKIAVDEYSIHVPFGKYILENEKNVPRSAAALARIRPEAERIIGEVTASELEWNRIQHLDGEALPGMTEDMFANFTLYGTNDVYETIGWSNPHRIVDRNPLPFMNNWIDINKNQKSPQEEKTANYLLSTVAKGTGKTMMVDDL